LMTENVLLSLLGGGLGIGLAYYGRGLLGRVLPPTSIPISLNGPIDVHVLMYVVALTSAAVLLFGLAPSFSTMRVDLAGVLKNGGQGMAVSSGRARSALVIAQFALSLTALVFGAVFLRRSA